MPSAASSPSMPWASPPPPPVIPRCAASPKSAMLQARRRQCWNRLPQMLEPAKGVLQPQATMLEPAFVFAGTSSNLCYNHLLILLEAAQFLLPSVFFFFLLEPPPLLFCNYCLFDLLEPAFVFATTVCLILLETSHFFFSNHCRFDFCWNRPHLLPPSVDLAATSPLFATSIFWFSWNQSLFLLPPYF